ncbi:hypothetical protein HYU12_02150 [Candidatus Woesearchaeota archaeon]|nr:hypothetical protein [Candidatus Woesearchaeota archaeon]
MIIDNNILFSLMKPDSAASEIFELGSGWEAPEFVKVELGEYEELCRKKSGLGVADFRKRRDEVFSRIRFVAVPEYKRFLRKALQLVEDIDDAPYVALALATRSPVWSNDSGMKRHGNVVVLSTEELIRLLS